MLCDTRGTGGGMDMLGEPVESYFDHKVFCPAHGCTPLFPVIRMGPRRRGEAFCTFIRCVEEGCSVRVPTA